MPKEKEDENPHGWQKGKELLKLFEKREALLPHSLPFLRVALDIYDNE